MCAARGPFGALTHSAERTRRQITAVDNRWWTEAVFYQIYPLSFADSNGDGVGDLPGVTRRLRYVRGLHVDAIWLNPFYVSPMRDFGYDIADYTAVDPVFGTLADFDELLAAAHEIGLKVIVDFVPNHTSDQHPWFQQSAASRDAANRDWYIWADPAPGGGPPNNWLSCFAETGSAWTLDERTQQYYLHSYTPHQPDLNWWNPRVQEAMDLVLRFWLDRGVNGFRIDVPHRLVKDRDLRDNPPEFAHLRRGYGEPVPPLRNLNQPEVHDILRGFRRTADEYGGRVLIGEVGLTDAGAVSTYYGRDDELHGVFSFDLWQQPWSARRIGRSVADTDAALPDDALPAFALSNHDITRAARRLHEDHDGRRRTRAAALLLLTLRAIPFLYYGEEIGMIGGGVDALDALDPDRRDGSRTPMQWNGARGAGFTSGTPWLPIPTSARSANVEAALADDGSLLALYRRILELRSQHPALSRGSYEQLLVDDHVLVYRRTFQNDRLLVAINFREHDASCVLPGEGGTILLSTSAERRVGRIRSPCSLLPNEGLVIAVA